MWTCEGQRNLQELSGEYATCKVKGKYNKTDIA
jgi:hypothetical protein